MHLALFTPGSLLVNDTAGRPDTSVFSALSPKQVVAVEEAAGSLM